MTFEERYFSGKCLFGDDLDAEGLAKWYADEERGYYDLAKSFNWGYDHYALDRFNLFDRLPQKHYPVCIASGCAGGDELQSVADRVGRFIAIEPAEAIWRKEPVGITPIEYMKPSVSGDIALPSSSVDLSIWLSSLHHVPNPAPGRKHGAARTHQHYGRLAQAALRAHPERTRISIALDG